MAAQLTQWDRSEEPATEADSCVVIVDCKEWFSWLDDFIRFMIYSDRDFWLAMLIPIQYQAHDCWYILTLTSYNAAVREGKRFFHRRQMSHLLITFCNFSIKTIEDWFLFLRYLCPVVMASPFPHLHFHLWWQRPVHQLSFDCLIITHLVQFWYIWQKNCICKHIFWFVADWTIYIFWSVLLLENIHFDFSNFVTLMYCILRKYISHISFDRLYCLATDCLALGDIALEVEKEAVTVEHFLPPGKKIVLPHFFPQIFQDFNYFFILIFQYFDIKLKV